MKGYVAARVAVRVRDGHVFNVIAPDDNDLDANLDSPANGTQNHGLSIQQRVDRVRVAIGRRVAMVRTKLTFRPDVFSYFVGFRESHLAALEAGTLPCTMGTLGRIGRAMNITLLQIVRGEVDPCGGFTSIEDERARVSRQIRVARESQGMSLAELALKAGVPGMMLGGIEFCALDPPMPALTKICIALGMPVHWLFTDCPAFLTDAEMRRAGMVLGDVAIVPPPDDDGWR